MKRIGDLLANIGYWLRTRLRGRRLLIALGTLLALGAVGAVGYIAIQELAEDDEPAPAPAPPIVVEADDEDAEPEAEAVEDLGFPAFATKNTTRVAGDDPVAAAAAIALAVFPSAGEGERPDAVTLVDADDWAGGIAASALVADPVRAPVLLTEGGEVPDLTTEALRALDPQGSKRTDDRQAFRIGGAAEPDDLRTLAVEGEDAAEIANGVDRLRQRLTGEDPEHIVVTSSGAPEWAMPAAAWAARSGDPVLFAERNSVPEPTLQALRRHDDVPVYVLGPEEAISEKSFRRIGKVAPIARRIDARDPVKLAIAFARYADGTFGWNINDPGHGFVVASTTRPIDAAGAAALSASGTWGPLLLTDDSAALPAPLRSYMLDVKPGYEDDPTRAVYNHIWLIGSESAISVPFQAEIDRIAELTRIRSGTGPAVGPAPGTPESEEADRKQDEP
jgi:hypothetical protein